MSGFCRNCGVPLNPNAKFCRSCGVRIQEVRKPDTVGRVAHDRDMSGPLRFFKEGIRSGMASLRQLFKTPKRLIPLIVLGTLWLILALLPALGINPWPVEVLSILTFAQGGMYGGVWGAIGGVIGKAVFAYFVSALILPLFRGKNPFKKSGCGGKGFFSGLALQSANAAAPLVFGLGLALVAYNFLTGNAGLVNGMAGLAALLLAIRSVVQKGGFLWGLLLSIVHKLSRGRVPSQQTVGRVITGYAAGSALGVAFSAVPWTYQPITAYIPYIAGGALIIIGVVLGIAIKPRREAASA